MRFLTTDNKVNTKLYYNNATLVSGNDKYNYFINEPTLLDSNQVELINLHKKIMVEQFSKYLKLKVKFNFLNNILMFFFKKDFLRGIVYKLIGRTKI